MARANHTDAHEIQKQSYDSPHTDFEFNVGDHVRIDETKRGLSKPKKWNGWGAVNVCAENCKTAYKSTMPIRVTSAPSANGTPFVGSLFQAQASADNPDDRA